MLGESYTVLGAPSVEKCRLVLTDDIDDNHLLLGDRYARLGRHLLNGLFVGLGSNDTVSGFGLIERVRPDDSIDLLTNHPEDFNSIHLSVIRLSKDHRREIPIRIVKSGGGSSFSRP